MLPNFLIVGQVKCGTSSLAQYLGQHPQVFMCPQKEPRFISSQSIPLPLGGPKDQAVESWFVKDLNAYQSLFADARQPAIGEASADTLYYYRYTIPVVRQLLGNPRIIILLRDPVQRAFSAWKHLRRDGREPLSFARALQQEQERIDKHFELVYHYQAASLYYQPVKAFLEAFQEVKILLTEELGAKPDKVLKEVFEFLRVDATFSCDTSIRFNMSGIPKNQRWHRALMNPDHPLRRLLKPLTRTLLPLPWRKRIIHALLAQNYAQANLSRELARHLREGFAEDIGKLEKLLERDLGLWYRRA